LKTALQLILRLLFGKLTTSVHKGQTAAQQIFSAVLIDENSDRSREDADKRVVLSMVFNGIVCDELRYSSAIYQAFRRLADLDQFSRCAS
jgi:hypothetical protein